MTSADDVKTLWKILDLIEENGGNIEGFDMNVESGDGIAGQMAAIMGGSGTTHYYVDITVPSEFDHDEGETVEIDGPASMPKTPDEDPRGSEVSD